MACTDECVWIVGNNTVDCLWLALMSVFIFQVQVEANKTAWAALVVHEENLDVEFKVSETRSRAENQSQGQSWRIQG